jgi:phage shock protein PspC (stress-responsive transcriptional regulator)
VQSVSSFPIFVKNKQLNKLKFFLEKHGFHVSSRLADLLGMRASSVRLFFIYLSFVTAGLGFAVYLTLAFWIRLKDLIRSKRTSVFDL